MYDDLKIHEMSSIDNVPVMSDSLHHQHQLSSLSILHVDIHLASIDLLIALPRPPNLGDFLGIAAQMVMEETLLV